MIYQSYDQIKNELSSLAKQERYQHLLMTTEWYSFRKKILDRDNHKCTICGKHENEYIQTKLDATEWEKLCAIEVAKGSKEGFLEFDEEYNVDIKYRQYTPPDIRVDKITLQVHHTLYVVGHLPWQYDQKHLITVCVDCHKKIHEKEVIFVYSDESFRQKKILPLCLKCHGSGFLKQYEYYYNGVCFDCMGEGVMFENEF